MYLIKRNASSQAARFLTTISEYPGGYSGKGIVVCAGGIRYNTCAWVLIRMLRHLGCKLPIQVWYLGKKESDESWMRLVEPYGVVCVNALESTDKLLRSTLNGWSLKSYAILHSPFEEVLLLDADNVPARNPQYLFDSPEYLQMGAIFWPDILPTRTALDSPRWGIFGVAPRDEPEQESGQLLIHKKKCWRSLQLCDWYNKHSRFFYKYIHGDKDTFRFAWHRVGQEFAMPERYPEIIPHALVQHDFQDEPIFYHRVGDKFSLDGNHRIAGFAHESLCFAFLDELRRLWRRSEGPSSVHGNQRNDLPAPVAPK
jgi:hypothetical protein